MRERLDQCLVRRHASSYGACRSHGPVTTGVHREQGAGTGTGRRLAWRWSIGTSDVDGHLLGRFMHVDRMRSGGYLLERLSTSVTETPSTTLASGKLRTGSTGYSSLGGCGQGGARAGTLSVHLDPQFAAAHVGHGSRPGDPGVVLAGQAEGDALPLASPVVRARSHTVRRRPERAVADPASGKQDPTVGE